MGSLGAESFDPLRSAAWAARNLECGVWIAEVDGVPVGTIGVHETTPWYSNTPYLTDGWLYVLPEHRNFSVASGLIGAAKQFAVEKGLPLVLNIFNMENTETKIKLFQRKGFKLVGGTFISGE